VPRDQLGADLKAASPVTYVAPGDPPFLIVDANNDEIVYPQQSRELSWDLGANGVPHRLVQVSQGGHQFDAAGESPSEKAIIGLVVDFFVRTLAFHQPFTSN
jgi:dipeptidyl aminopeptidase/acylaminoacyl peptidase